MRLGGICIARNEAHELGLTLRAMLMWLDFAVVLDHASTDGTGAIIAEVAAENPGRVIALREAEPTWFEMANRQRCLDVCRDNGATHIVTVDADEILSANLLQLDSPTMIDGATTHYQRVRNLIYQTPPNHAWCPPWIGLKGGSGQYYVSGRWYGNYCCVAFKDDPVYHWRAAADGFDHHHRHPNGRAVLPNVAPTQATDPALHQGGLMHLQFVNLERLKWKQYLYKLIELTRWGRVRSDYDGTVRDALSGNTAPVNPYWWAGYEHLMQYYHPEEGGWHEGEVRRILAERPALAKGLTDYGLGLIP